MSIINDGKRITQIVATTVCGKHAASSGNPCWAFEGGTPGNVVIGVCGSRIRAAGYNGKISQGSLRRK